MRAPLFFALAALMTASCGRKEAATSPAETPEAASTAAPASPSAPANGKAVYEKWCAACHDPGVHHPGASALTEKYAGVKSGVLLEWNDLAPETVRYFVRNGISVMPQFRKTEISDEELDALAAYLSGATQ